MSYDKFKQLRHKAGGMIMTILISISLKEDGENIVIVMKAKKFTLTGLPRGNLFEDENVINFFNKTNVVLN